MGNLACCVSKPAPGSNNNLEEDTKIHQILEEDRKRNIDEGLRNMANGGHQLIAGFTAPHVFKREAGKSYYPFNWGPDGSVPITSFGVKIVASGNDVQFVEGLANYATFMCSWKPDNKEGHLLITLDNYKSVDANTGEETPVNTPPKKFLVDREGNFVGIVNLDELVNEAVEQAVAVAGGQDDKTEEQKQELKKILMQQRDVMVKGVVGDVSLMWRCWVQVWTHEERSPNEETEVYGFKCARRKKVLGSDAEENKQTLRKFYDDLFDNLNKSSQGSVNQDKSPTNGKKKHGQRDAKERQSQSSFRPEVILEQAKQLEVYNALFVSEGVRCHQSSYRKFTESSITIQGEKTERAEFEGKRWVFGWRDIPMLSSRAYMVSLFSEYATVAGAFHDALQEKYNDHASHNIFEMLVAHQFITEPNEEVIKADKDKQRIAAMNQMAGGAHSMFSGLSPPIKYEDRASNSYQFDWPREGSVKVYALGFTIKITDGEAKFTQGLGTFITFVVRWQPAQLEGHTDVFLENNVLIVAATGAEESLPEPVKHILVDRSGALVKVVNMDQLVSYAVDTAIQQKGNISEEEKKQYRDMLEKTQKETLTKAVECDLSFIWASWVQMWVHQQKTGTHAETDAFGKTCVTLERSNESSPDENKKTVLALINSVLGEEKKNEFEIKVEVAKQSERYKTTFEKDTLRPHDAKYEKITETVLSFGSHQVHQKEFKNSCHVFIWPDIPKLATKEYATAVYQNYLNQANTMYDELRPSATPQ